MHLTLQTECPGFCHIISKTNLNSYNRPAKIFEYSVFLSDLNEAVDDSFYSSSAFLQVIY